MRRGLRVAQYRDVDIQDDVLELGDSEPLLEQMASDSNRYVVSWESERRRSRLDHQFPFYQ